MGNGKLGAKLTPMDYGDVRQMTRHRDCLAREKAELDAQVAPINRQISDLHQAITVLDWKIASTEMARERAIGVGPMSKGNPYGCPAEHRGAWDGTRDKARPTRIRAKLTEAELSALEKEDL